MKLVVINGNGQGDYDVSAHRADCADVPKAIKGHDFFREEHPTKRDAWLDYNSDFLAEKSGAWPIHFYPCTEGLPDGGRFNTPDDEPERLATAGDAVKDWQGNIGVVTTPVKKAGIHKGKVAVMWLGSNYEVVADPDGLTVIKVQEVPK
jgi:hypothetical protein